jgi:hypothetical protein
VNYLVDTAFTTDVGFGGAAASCIFAGGNDFGWNMSRSVNNWDADVFTIPADTSWAFDTVIVYGYQAGNSSTTSAFLECQLEIYDGPPGLGGNVIWGDTVTNVLASTGWTGIYRVDTVTSAGGLNQTIRPIMYLKLHLAPAPHLATGTYWLAWSSAGTGTPSNFSSPEKVLPGRINPPGQQARWHEGSMGLWSYAVDRDNDIGFNKIIKASDSVAAVPKINIITGILNQNAPNPCSGSTNISFYLPSAGYTKLAVYNTIGQLVVKLTDGNTDAGWHSVTLNAEELPAGTYYYRLNTDAGVVCKEMQIVK